MKTVLDQLIESSADPQATALRIERMYEDAEIRKRIESLHASLLADLVSIISISNFMFHFLCRRPPAISLLGQKSSPCITAKHTIPDLDALRLFKYQELLKITWMDVSRTCEYPEVLDALSTLAVTIVRQAIRLSLSAESYHDVAESLAVLALGKLGAHELNYSSDIDLIFVSRNLRDEEEDAHALQKKLIDSIRCLSRALEEKTADGFLYRVDLKLRPWGRSGPLVLSIDDTEYYYEASSEPWERFAWLRARAIAGSESVASELLSRIRPFVFRRSLSTDDLDRFVQIKNDMSKARKRHGHWNVKVGEGGIRDIEFFIQVLQIVNAAKHKQLQTTNTLTALANLEKTNLITAEQSQQLYGSYNYLRRLENRLQMIDEQQTHDLPDDKKQRYLIARSLGVNGSSMNEVLDNFENELFAHRSIAQNYFDRVLPQGG